MNFNNWILCMPKICKPFTPRNWATSLRVKKQPPRPSKLHSMTNKFINIYLYFVDRVKAMILSIGFIDPNRYLNLFKNVNYCCGFDESTSTKSLRSL